MIRADYRNGPGYQGQPQLKGDGAGKAGRGHDISKDPRVRKQVEWQTFKQVCGWAAVNTVLEELATCHCAGAPLRLGASTRTQVHVIYWYSCHFAHSMTCPWVCRFVVPQAGNTDNTVQKVNISERSAVHQNHTCLIQISTQAHAACALWPLALLAHGAPPQGPPLDCSVASGRCIFAISNVRQLLAKESVETWVCSPATVRHQAVCSNVRNRTKNRLCSTANGAPAP